MARQSWVSSRVMAGVVVVAVVLIIVLLLVLPSDSNDDPDGLYTADEVGGFRPTEGEFLWTEPWTEQAGEAWQYAWPDESFTQFDPPECRTYLAAVEIMLATDESETAEDGLAFIQGALADQDVDSDEFVGVYLKTRTFSSTSAASDFVSDLRSMADPCAGGYSYLTEIQVETVIENLVGRVDSVAASTTNLDDIGEVLVIEERNWVVQVSGEVVEDIPYYTHFVYSQGNAVIVVSYVVARGPASGEDAADVIGQFIDHLGE